MWEGIAGMIGEFLPSKTVSVGVTGGDSPHVTVEGIADITMAIAVPEALPTSVA